MPVTSKRGWLYINFTCDLPGGRRSRRREATRLNDTPKNRKLAQAKDKAIQYELRTHQFDYLRHFPHGAMAQAFREHRGRDPLFSEWWNEWILEKALRPNTARNWESVYRVHLGPAFGARALSEITDHEVLVYRKRLLDRGLSPSTINDKIIKVLCMALYRAHERGILTTYPCRGLGRLAENPPEIEPFTFDEIVHFLNVLREKAPEFHEMVFVWYRTGLRPGELCALKWKHLDRYNRKLLVRETRYPSGTEGPPKTQHSRREIPLRPQVLEAFRKQEERTGLQGGHVFLTRAGRPFSDAFLRKKFRHLCRLAGLAYRPPKNLRHTFATHNIAAGEQISWVSRVLGHASIKITAERYNRYVQDLTREDGSALEGVLEGREKGRFDTLATPGLGN